VLLDILKEKDAAIGTARKEPRLCWMKRQRQYSKFVAHVVALENLNWHQQGIPHQIRIHHAVKDVNYSIIGSTRHEGISIMIADGTEGAFVISMERKKVKYEIKKRIIDKEHHSLHT